MNKLLIIRFSAIGDVVLTVHAVRALRAKYPSLEITIATREHLLCLFESIGDLKFFMMPKHPSLNDCLGLYRQLRGESFDAIADLQSDANSHLLCTMLRRGSMQVEHFDREKRALRLLTSHKSSAPVRNEVLRFLDVFARLGLSVEAPPVVRTLLPVPAEFGGEKTGRWVGIAPFTTKLTKMYPLDRAEEVVRLLCERFDKVFIFSGPDAEQHFCEQMRQLYPEKVEMVYGRTNLAGEVALISNLDLLVTAAGATMQMSTLTGAPLLALWGGTHPDCGYGAYGADPAENYLQLDLPCRPCSAFGEGCCRREDYACLNRITPAMVMKRVEEMTKK